MQNRPKTRKLVLIGGGHSHALVLKSWRPSFAPDVELTVINPGHVAAYSGMLPGFVAGHYARSDLDLNIADLAQAAGATLIQARATGIDRNTRRIEISGHPPLAYDMASIDIGITSNMPHLLGFSDHGIAAKPLEHFATLWDTFRTGVTRGEVAPQVAVIGGGVAGAELAMAIAYRLRAVPDAQVTLIDRSDILTEMRPGARDTVIKALTALGVALRPQAPVTQIAAQSVQLKDGSQVPSQFTLGAAGARPYDWLTDTGLELENGFIRVGPSLQSSDPRIFAVGDCAYLSHDPRPKAGVYAVRAAPILFHNLRAALADAAQPNLKAYHPQKDYLKLVSLGEKAALADKFGLCFSGPLLWRLKDHIDRKFMRHLNVSQPSAQKSGSR